MVNLRFKHCISCGKERPWQQERCPQCNETDFDTTVRDGKELVESAIGDSVDERILVNAEVPRVDISEGRRISRIIPERVKNKAEERTVKLLNNPISEYLLPDEQPHFILQSKNEIIRDQDEGESKLFPSSGFGSPRIIITDQRVIFFIGQEDGDIVKTVEHSEVTSVDSSEGIIRASLKIHSEHVDYEIQNCNPMDEIKPVIAYLSAQQGSEGPNTAEEFNYEKGDSRGERVKSVLHGIDGKKVAEMGWYGAKFGKRAGPKGTVMGFLAAAGFEIWSEISEQDVSSAESPDPEDFAQNVNEWREAGAETGDERVEWLSSTLAATVTIAAHNSDHQVVQELESIDPQSLVFALQSGAELVDVSELPGPSATDLETLPEISNIRRPVSELTAVSEELFEEGIFEEIAKKHRDLDNA